MAPPHPRGSTPHQCWQAGAPEGSPASAGIDPISVHATQFATWLPRIRGDRPRHQRASLRRSQAPPHPRGSTRSLTAFGDDLKGSPASAGIDPSTPSNGGNTPRLPRIRGDRPGRRSGLAGWCRAPPHPRGSTLPFAAPAPVEPGSPAPAGIDPSASCAAAGDRRLPRTRGDRPAMAAIRRRRGRAPPHPRGSTLSAIPFRNGRGGSPHPRGSTLLPDA